MARNLPHALLPETTHDEACRQRFVLDLKRMIARHARPLARAAYERDVKPALVAALGREPASPAELAAPMYASQPYQVFSALHRAAQEMMWDAVAAPLVRDLPRLRSLAAQLAASPRSSPSAFPCSTRQTARPSRSPRSPVPRRADASPQRILHRARGA